LSSLKRQLNEAADRVGPVAHSVAEKCVARPLRQVISADPVYGPLAGHVKVFDQDGSVVVTARGEAGAHLMDLEVGTETAPPSRPFFFTAKDQRAEAQAEFRRQLMGAE
jgi:hypothetical protein